MRFIYKDCLVTMRMWNYNDLDFKWVHTVEDLEDEIIWLIQDINSWREMREYYVKG